MIGTKYQTFNEDDELLIYRMFKERKNPETNRWEYTLLDKDDKKIKIDSRDNLNKMVILRPDATMNIMITTNNRYQDVYVCVHNCSKGFRETPDLILRQDILSVSKNWISGNQTFVGDCITEATAPDKKSFTNLMDFEGIKYSASVALYIDDTLDDIKKLLDQVKFKRFDNLLKEMKRNHSNPTVIGYCSDLITLMEENNFIANYRSIFNIAQLDFPIKLEDNYTDDGVITLNKKQISRFQEFIGNYATDISVLEYDKDIDISKIIRNTHMVVSDSNQKIFIINYKIGPTIQSEDVVVAMNNALK
jgi:hypothetical protein